MKYIIILITPYQLYRARCSETVLNVHRNTSLDAFISGTPLLLLSLDTHDMMVLSAERQAHQGTRTNHYGV